MRLKYEYATMELNGETVAVPVGKDSRKTQGMIKLNKTGASIFTILKEDVSEEDIVDKMSLKYDVPRDRLTADVHEYINVFREKGLLID